MSFRNPPVDSVDKAPGIRPHTSTNNRIPCENTNNNNDDNNNIHNPNHRSSTIPQLLDSVQRFKQYHLQQKLMRQQQERDMYEKQLLKTSIDGYPGLSTKGPELDAAGDVLKRMRELALSMQGSLSRSSGPSILQSLSSVPHDIGNRKNISSLNNADASYNNVPRRTSLTNTLLTNLLNDSDRVITPKPNGLSKISSHLPSLLPSRVQANDVTSSFPTVERDLTHDTIENNTFPFIQAPDVRMGMHMGPHIIRERPANTPRFTLKPHTYVTTTIQPDSPTPTTVQPHSPTTTTVQPHSPTPTTVQPHSPTPTTVQPHSPTPTTVQPDSPTPTTVQPDSPTPTSIHPDMPSPRTTTDTSIYSRTEDGINMRYEDSDTSDNHTSSEDEDEDEYEDNKEDEDDVNESETSDGNDGDCSEGIICDGVKTKVLFRRTDNKQYKFMECVGRWAPEVDVNYRENVKLARAILKDEYQSAVEAEHIMYRDAVRAYTTYREMKEIRRRDNGEYAIIRVPRPSLKDIQRGKKCNKNNKNNNYSIVGSIGSHYIKMAIKKLDKASRTIMPSFPCGGGVSEEVHAALCSAYSLISNTILHIQTKSNNGQILPLKDNNDSNSKKLPYISKAAINARNYWMPPTISGAVSGGQSRTHWWINNTNATAFCRNDAQEKFLSDVSKKHHELQDITEKGEETAIDTMQTHIPLDDNNNINCNNSNTHDTSNPSHHHPSAVNHLNRCLSDQVCCTLTNIDNITVLDNVVRREGNHMTTKGEQGKGLLNGSSGIHDVNTFLNRQPSINSEDHQYHYHRRRQEAMDIVNSLLRSVLDIPGCDRPSLAHNEYTEGTQLLPNTSTMEVADLLQCGNANLPPMTVSVDGDVLFDVVGAKNQRRAKFEAQHTAAANKIAKTQKVEAVVDEGCDRIIPSDGEVGHQDDDNSKKNIPNTTSKPTEDETVLTSDNKDTGSTDNTTFPIMGTFKLPIIMDPYRTGSEEVAELPLTPGSLIAGRYQLIDVLGQATFSRAVRCIDLKQRYRLVEDDENEDSTYVVDILENPDPPVAMGMYRLREGDDDSNNINEDNEGSDDAHSRLAKDNSRIQKMIDSWSSSSDDSIDERSSHEVGVKEPNDMNDNHEKKNTKKSKLVRKKSRRQSAVGKKKTEEGSPEVSELELNDEVHEEEAEEEEEVSISKSDTKDENDGVKYTTNTCSGDNYVQLCLKVINNTKEFFDQSLDEIRLLHLLNTQGDPDKQHFVRMYDYFYTREHTFIATELLSDNLYEYGKYITDNDEPTYFTVPRVRSIAKQILKAIKFVHSLNLIHSDLKPENILFVSHTRCIIKVIDFGSSTFTSDHLSSYVQSRSYRAPEVILGADYDGRIDIWSIGAILVELITQEVLFQSETSAEMLARIVSICGVPIPRAMLYEGRTTSNFIDRFGGIFETMKGADGDSHEDCFYLYTPVHVCPPQSDLHDVSLFAVEGSSSDQYNNNNNNNNNSELSERADDNSEQQQQNQTHRRSIRYKPLTDPYAALKAKLLPFGIPSESLLVDFICKCLTMDHKLRPTAIELMSHPFLQETEEDDINIYEAFRLSQEEKGLVDSNIGVCYSGDTDNNNNNNRYSGDYDNDNDNYEEDEDETEENENEDACEEEECVIGVQRQVNFDDDDDEV